MRDSELKYNTLERHAYALVKAVKFFRIYLLHSRILAYIPNATVKEILTQTESEGKMEHWITNIMEYDVEIRPTKLVKGYGLDKFLVDSNCQYLCIHLMKDQSVQ